MGGIYRGPGGTGDATADAASEASLIKTLAVEVQADADAAEAARAAAVTAQIAAELAETNAETAEANAETAETNAETAQAAAASSASAAATSATNAANSATAAQTAETNAETAETNAAASASAASTSATNAASSASSASASASTATTQATNAANSASAAATSATNASNSASAAATSATNASNSATAASGSATSAASSASTATTQAGIATTQASNAASSASAASTSASNAATSATNASNSASAASTSATNASNSASSASTSASNASTSEIAAAASAAAAAASYDSFDDRYLGAKSAAPTLDNDGNALIAGALYYNNGTVTPADKGMYVYDGTQWIAASAASTAILVVYQYTATGGQTTFSGTDNNSLTLAYTAGSALVTLNGVILEVGTEVTATTGTSVVLASGAVAGDELNVYAFSTFDIANVYTQAQSDATFLTKSNPSYTGTLTGGTGVVNIGSGQLYKDASGNVGIGTSSPVSIAGYTIQTLNNGTTGGGVYLQSNGTSIGRILNTATDMYVGGVSGSSKLFLQSGGAVQATIDSSGKVGIGTSSPTAILSCYATGGSTVAGLFRTDQTDAYISFRASGTASDFSCRMGVIGENLVFLNNGANERMRLDSSGNLLVGTTSATGYRLTVNNNGNGGISVQQTGLGQYSYISNAASLAGTYYHAQFLQASTPVGSITSTGSSTSYNTSSDYRLKENIAPMTGAIDVVQQLKPVTYNWKVDGSDGQGFIAHELQAVVPDCVTGEKDAVDKDGKPIYQGIDVSFLVATLTAAIQEQQAQLTDMSLTLANANAIITDLRTELDSLKSEVTALKGQA